MNNISIFSILAQWMNVLHKQFLDILGKGKQMTEKRGGKQLEEGGRWTGGCGMWFHNSWSTI